MHLSSFFLHAGGKRALVLLNVSSIIVHFGGNAILKTNGTLIMKNNGTSVGFCCVFIIKFDGIQPSVHNVGSKYLPFLSFSLIH